MADRRILTVCDLTVDLDFCADDIVVWALTRTSNDADHELVANEIDQRDIWIEWAVGPRPADDYIRNWGHN